MSQRLLELQIPVLWGRWKYHRGCSFLPFQIISINFHKLSKDYNQSFQRNISKVFVDTSFQFLSIKQLYWKLSLIPSRWGLFCFTLLEIFNPTVKPILTPPKNWQYKFSFSSFIPIFFLLWAVHFPRQISSYTPKAREKDGKKFKSL